MKKIYLEHDCYFFFKLATIALVALIIFLQVRCILHYPIWYDDTAFASVAKNLANGEGYKAVFFDQNYAFHFGITSGPTVIAPTALMIFIFGNKYWVPQLANILLIWSLLLVIFFLADDFIGKKKKWLFCFFALLFSFLFSIGIYGNENPDRLTLWHLLMGEIPAALCTIIAAFLLFAPRILVRKIFASDLNNERSPSKARKRVVEGSEAELTAPRRRFALLGDLPVLGGLFLGFAVMSKSIAGIAIAAIFLAFILKTFCAENLKKLQKIKLIFAVGICAISPFISFELIKIISLGWSQYLEMQRGLAEFYLHNAAIVKSAASNEVTISTDIGGRISYLKKSLWAVWLIFAPATLYIAYISCQKKDRSSWSLVAAAFALILAFFIYLVWWLYFSTGYYRYLAVAFIYYFCGLSLLLANIDYQKQSRWQIGIIFLFIFLLLASRDRESDYLISVISYGNDRKMQEHLVVRDAVQELQKQGVTMISCGNNSELEYLLPKSGNFKRCEEMLNGSLDQPVILVSSFVNPMTMPQYTIRVDIDHYYANIRLIPDQILQRCDRQYLRTENYSLNWCQ